MKIKNITKALSKHAGTGLAVGAMIGVVITCYCVAKEAPKAKEALEELDEDAGVVEKAKTVAKNCKGSIISATTTEAMILGSNFAHKRTIAALTAFAATQVTKNNEFEAAVKKTFGDDSAKKAHKSVVEEHMHQPEILETAIRTGHGNILCYEPLCGHFFYASRAFIENERVNLEKSAMRMGDDYITMNEWFDSLRLPMTVLGDNYGWPRDLDTDTIGITFDTGQVEGIPYLLIEYDEMPIEMGVNA